MECILNVYNQTGTMIELFCKQDDSPENLSLLLSAPNVLFFPFQYVTVKVVGNGKSGREGKLSLVNQANKMIEKKESHSQFVIDDDPGNTSS